MGNSLAAKIARFTDLLMDAVCMVDADGRFVFVSAACERIFGYAPEEMIGMQMINLVAPADRERTLAAARAIMDGEPTSRFENRYVRKDGKLVHIMWSARWSETDQLRVAVARDITASKQADAVQSALYAISEAAHASDDLPALFRDIHQIIDAMMPAPGFSVALRGDKDGSVEFSYHVNADGSAAPPALARRLAEEVLRSGQAALLPDCWLGVPLTTSQGCIGVLMLQSGDGPDQFAYSEQDQELLMFVSKQVATAIQRKQLHSRLRFMAQHDELTQLPNRRLFLDRLLMAVARAQRHQGQLALLFIDLNKFKQINDEHGHACGDQLLREVAQRLKHCVRESDTVARLGGDEFVVIVEEVLVAADTQQIVEKIHQVLAMPMALDDGLSLTATASIGVAHYPEHGSDIAQLMRYADQAMYAAKQTEEHIV